MRLNGHRLRAHEKEIAFDGDQGRLQAGCARPSGGLDLHLRRFLFHDPLAGTRLIPHYAPVLPVLLVRGGRDIIQDLMIKRGILGVLIFNITPVCKNVEYR